MIRADALFELYQSDETAWLEHMAYLAANGQTEVLDLDNLSEYLQTMANREKRDVVDRLVALLVILLKWDVQADIRTRSLELTLHEQIEDLQDLLRSHTLRNHARAELERAYARAVRRAVVETDAAEGYFPAKCLLTLEQIVPIA